MIDGTFAIWTTSAPRADADQSGSGTYDTALELDERAGIPAPDVLRAAAGVRPR